MRDRKRLLLGICAAGIPILTGLWNHYGYAVDVEQTQRLRDVNIISGHDHVLLDDPAAVEAAFQATASATSGSPKYSVV